MMGRKHREQASLFYEFRLDDMIPKDHILRRINVFVTSVLGDLHEQLGPFYSDIGRPSIDPELLIRMLIVGYCFGIRSERKLCEEVRLHLAYRWFCRLDLNDDGSPPLDLLREPVEPVPRERHPAPYFRARRHSCDRDGPRQGRGVCCGRRWRQTRAVITARRPMKSIGLRNSGRSVRWLAALEAEAAAEGDAPNDSESGGPGSKRQRRYEHQPPKVISPSDPQSAWTAKANKRVQFGYEAVAAQGTFRRTRRVSSRRHCAEP
jgi:hypothetical protein